MADTHVLLSKVTVGATGASSITFSNIPQTGYTDLLIKISGRCTRAADQSNLVISFNGSTSSFTGRYLEGLNTSVPSATFARFIGAVPAATSTANTFGNFEVYIPNYTSSNYKSFSADAVQETNSTNSYLELNAGLWSNTAAITSISIASNSSDNFAQYTTAYLYGISNVNTTPTIGPSATGGDIITNDGTYWIHTFLSSGTFTPLKALSCDALVVAGGGGGGTGANAYRGGGGGGAGGMRTGTISVTATAYTITVGAGGPGMSVQANGASPSGNTSSFSTISTTGGGGGADGAGYKGGNGGSGGGNGGYSETAGTGISGEGNDGGFSTGGSSRVGAGGGGKGSVGNASTTGGTGGSNNYSGASVTYATGGNGGSSTGNENGASGTSNTGNGGNGGGGAATPTNSGGAGGSGIVIIRYAM